MGLEPLKLSNIVLGDCIGVLPTPLFSHANQCAYTKFKRFKDLTLTKKKRVCVRVHVLVRFSIPLSMNFDFPW